MRATFVCLLGTFGAALAAPSYEADGEDRLTRSYSRTASTSFASSTEATQHSVAGTKLQRPPLLPAVRWDRARDDLEELAPRTSHDLYFSSHGTADPSLKHAFADFHATWTKEVVVLDHSNLIDAVTCVEGDISIEFSSEESYNFAKSTWSDDRDFLLVGLPCLF